MKNTNGKTIALVALVVSVLGLSIGFAAFSQNLVISSSATVTPAQENLDVAFKAGTYAGTVAGEAANAASITLDSNATTISGLTATFKKPGDSVTYSLTVENNSPFVAYLKNISFAKSTPTCTSVSTNGNGATDAYLTAVCQSMRVTVTPGSETGRYPGSNAVFTGHSLAAKTTTATTETVTVKLEYLANGAVADGDFSVDFGDVTLNYSSAD